MEIKYYGVEGARLEGGFNSPDYFVNRILENKDKILINSYLHNFTGQMEHLEVQPYEKGVVYKINNLDSSDNYNAITYASIIVSGDSVSFIVNSIDKTYNSTEELQELAEANRKVESDIINGLGKAYPTDKVGNYQKSDNKFIRVVETRQEQSQRANYTNAVSKSMETLKEAKRQLDAEKSIEITPYQKIAKDALMNWNGLSEEEANNKIMTESVEQLEGQVYAMGSVGYAVSGISQNLGLTEEERNEFYNAVINGPADAPIFASISAKAGQVEDPNQLELSVLSTIHDGWVVDNSSDKTYQKKVDRGQLRQYAPLELIGWNEAKSDLLFLGPVLESINVPLNEEQLEKAYHDMVSSYASEMKITDPESLNALVAEGKNYYPALPEQLSEKLVANSQVVTQQIIENWNSKDPKSLQAINQAINMDNVEGMHR